MTMNTLSKKLLQALMLVFCFSCFTLDAAQSKPITSKYLGKAAKIKKSGNEEFPIPTSVVLAQLRKTLSGLKIHLNNHGRKHNDPNHHKSWLVQESYIEWNGNRQAVELEEMVHKLKRRHYLYYINDINLKTIKASIQNNKLEIRLVFETDRFELKGHCLIKRKKMFGGWASCPVGSDKGAPDIDLINPQLIAKVDVLPYRGSISIANLNLEYQGRAQINGPLSIFDKLVSKQIKKQIEKHLRQLINTNNFRQDIAREMRKQLDSLGIGRVINVRIQGRQFIITHRR